MANSRSVWVCLLESPAFSQPTNNILLPAPFPILLRGVSVGDFSPISHSGVQMTAFTKDDAFTLKLLDLLRSLQQVEAASIFMYMGGVVNLNLLAGPAALPVKAFPIFMVSLPSKLPTNGLKTQFPWFSILASIWSTSVVGTLT